jgi:hypothetical protein
VEFFRGRDKAVRADDGAEFLKDAGVHGGLSRKAANLRGWAPESRLHQNQGKVKCNGAGFKGPDNGYIFPGAMRWVSRISPWELFCDASDVNAVG